MHLDIWKKEDERTNGNIIWILIRIFVVFAELCDMFRHPIAILEKLRENLDEFLTIHTKCIHIKL